MIFWDLTSCSLVDMFKHSGRICCLYLQGTLSCSDCMWVWDLMVPMHLGLSYPALTVEAADCSETSVVPVAQYSHLHCHYSETPSNTRNISLLKRVFSGKKKKKIHCTARNVYFAFNQTAFSYWKIMFSGLSKNEKLNHKFYGTIIFTSEKC